MSSRTLAITDKDNGWHDCAVGAVRPARTADARGSTGDEPGTI